MITSVGVLAGLVLATLTGWAILDPLIAGAVAINILRIGYRLAVESMSQLMDEAASPEIEARIRAAIKANADGALQAHDIRTRTAGPATFIEFHLVVPGAMTVEAAHDDLRPSGGRHRSSRSKTPMWSSTWSPSTRPSTRAPSTFKRSRAIALAAARVCRSVMRFDQTASRCTAPSCVAGALAVAPAAHGAERPTR